MKRSILRQKVSIKLFHGDFRNLSLWHRKQIIWVKIALLFKPRARVKPRLEVLKQWMNPRHRVVSLTHLSAQKLQIEFLIRHQIYHITKTNKYDQNEYSNQILGNANQAVFERSPN